MLGLIIAPGFLVSCRTLDQAPPPVLPPSPAVSLNSGVDVGSVAHVNPDDGYVILRCAVLPYDQEELKVYRNGMAVGRLRVSGPQKPPFFAADILEGHPRQGDRAQRTATNARDRRSP